MNIRRLMVDIVGSSLCWIGKRRVVRPSGQVVKVNLGSGLTVAPDWINVDASLNAFFSKWPRFVLRFAYKLTNSNKSYSQAQYCDILQHHVFIHHNLKYGMPFPDDSIDYLYSSHLLEHLFWEDAKKLLKEACRVLKKGGILRLCIPDLEYAMSLYREGDKERALRFFFEKAEASSVSYHRYMYDFDMLQEFLEEAGFASIARCRFRRGKTPDTDKLEYRAEESLFVEATK